MPTPGQGASPGPGWGLKHQAREREEGELGGNGFLSLASAAHPPVLSLLKITFSKSIFDSNMTIPRLSGAMVEGSESSVLNLIPGSPFRCGWDPFSFSDTDLGGWLWASMQNRHIKPLTRDLAPTPGVITIIEHWEPPRDHDTWREDVQNRPPSPVSVPDSWVDWVFPCTHVLSVTALVHCAVLVCFLVYLPIQATGTLSRDRM